MDKTAIRKASHSGLGVIVLAACCTVTNVYAKDTLKLSIGYDYSTGEYGQNVTTEITAIPISLRYTSGAVSWKLSMPYLRITGNGTVVPGPGGPTTFNDFSSGLFGGGFGMGSGSGSSSSESVSLSGPGDLTASVGYALFPANGNFHEFTAKLKLATADESKGLGTGENDYYLQYDTVFNAGKLLPMLTLGYVITGDSASMTYKDVFYGSAGVMIRTGQQATAGIVYDVRKATVAGSDDLKQASAFLNWNNSPQWSTTLSASTGFSDSSPDLALNATLTRQF